jgi:ABC-type transport system substrate-binding protein
MNFQCYNNDRVNALYEESKRQLTFEDTEAIYYEISKVLMEDYPIIPLFSMDSARLVQDRVKGYDHKGKLEYAWSKYYSLDRNEK